MKANNPKTNQGILKIFEYLKEMVEIYSNVKCDAKDSEISIRKDDNIINFQQQNYESLIRKLEIDLRNHMKVNFSFNFMKSFPTFSELRFP